MKLLDEVGCVARRRLCWVSTHPGSRSLRLFRDVESCTRDTCVAIECIQCITICKQREETIYYQTLLPPTHHPPPAPRKPCRIWLGSRHENGRYPPCPPRATYTLHYTLLNRILRKTEQLLHRMRCETTILSAAANDLFNQVYEAFYSIKPP